MISQERKKKLERNIWKFYLYRIASAWFFFSPIYVLFFLDLGFSMTQIMLLQSFYAILIVITLIPCGLIADHIGRKKLLITPTFLHTTAGIIIVLTSKFSLILIAYALFSLSTATWNASGTPFFYDNLRELGKEKKFKKLFGNVTAINYIVMGLGSLIGGIIATYGMRLTFLATATTMFIAGIIAFTFTETKHYKHAEKNYITRLENAIKFTTTHPRIRMLMIFSAIYWGSMIAVFLLFQPFFESLGIPLIYFGVIYMTLYFIGGVNAKLAHKSEKFFNENDMLLLIGVFSLTSILFMSFNILIIGVIAAIIMFSMWGMFETLMADYIHKHVESHHRSTIQSFNMLVGQLSITVLGPFIGWIVDMWNLQTAFLFSGGLLTVNLFILLGAFAIAKRSKK